MDEYMRAYIVPVGERFLKICELVDQYKIAAKNYCNKRNITILTSEFDHEMIFEYHSIENKVELIVGPKKPEYNRRIHQENVHKLGELKAEPHGIPINIPDLFHELETWIIRERITLLDIERLIMELL